VSRKPILVLPGAVLLVLLTAARPAATPPGRPSADLLVVNARVVTMDDRGTVFSPGALAVSRGAIVAVGPSADIARDHAAKETFDARGAIVLPGLVNTHTHAAMDLLRGIADDLPLDRWLKEDIFPAEAKNVSAQFVYDGTLLAALEMIRGGTTTFADMYYFESEAARAVDKAGLRGVLGETFIDFPVPDHKDLAAALAYMETFAARWKGHPRVVPAVAPHAPYTCSKETLLACRDFAHRHSLPLIIHVAETRKELEDARTAWKKTPFGRLADVGFFDPSASGARVPIVAAHAVWMEEADFDLVRRYGVGLSHNPESNMKLASGIADVPGWVREGFRWGLGTDGSAGSNNDLSMFEAMDFAGKLAKVSKADPTVLPAPLLVRAATRGGAEVLGLSDRIGTLEAGKRADFIVVGTGNAHVEPAEDVYSTLVYSAKASDVTDVWVDGNRLLAAGRPRTLDEPAILEAARRWRARVRASLAPAAPKEKEKP
jgi:5-methylthioadenosine/S-adenosylhomocysteine deaminase